MKIAIKTTKTRSAKELADIALKHRLYVSGWRLTEILQDIRKGRLEANVAIAYDQGVPIGVSILLEEYRDNMDHIQVFVRKSYRRNGIGKKLVNRLCKQKGNVYAIYGVEQSIDFFNNLGITWTF